MSFRTEMLNPEGKGSNANENTSFLEYTISYLGHFRTLELGSLRFTKTEH